MVTGVVVQLLGPMVFGRAGDGSSSIRVGHARSLTHQAAAAAFLVTLALTASTAVYHRSAFALLVGPEYRHASPFLPMMILAGGIFATGQIVAINLMSAGQPQRLVGPKIGSALTGIGLNIAGAHYFGFAGVVYAAVITSALYCGWVLWLSGSQRVHRA
jgi:O-antigen/teichoic acid export membrane protein